MSKQTSCLLESESTTPLHPDPSRMTDPDRQRSLGILHVVDTLETGGLERVVSDLAIAQRESGQRSFVFSILATDGFREILERAGVPVLVGNKCGTLDLSVLAKLRRALQEHSIDIIHSHNFVPNYYSAIASLALRRRPRLVNTCHNMGTRLVNHRLRWLYRASLWRTARVAAVGAQVREHLVSKGIVADAKAMTVLNGIPVERFKSSAQRRQAARNTLGIDADALVIGSVGRLVALKNHALLIAQMPILLRKYPELRLVLIGDGPLVDVLREQAATLGVGDRVILTRARSDIVDLLPAFDVFALPSMTEGISIALLEACASGLAVIASAVGGNVEIVDHGRNGLLVPVADGEALNAAADRLLADPTLRQHLGDAAATWVSQHASMDVMRDAYDTFYRSAFEPS